MSVRAPPLRQGDTQGEPGQLDVSQHKLEFRHLPRRDSVDSPRLQAPPFDFVDESIPSAEKKKCSTMLGCLFCKRSKQVLVEEHRCCQWHPLHHLVPRLELLLAHASKHFGISHTPSRSEKKHRQEEWVGWFQDIRDDP